MMPKKKGPISSICTHCSAVFSTWPHLIATGHGKYCTPGCYHAARPAGTSRSPEHISWMNMKARCQNSSRPEWANYGGRGIVVCDRWQNSFKAFLADVGRRPGPEYTIDRIDTNCNYEPGNVRWATRTEQQRNRRTNRFLTFGGETHCMSEWATMRGLSLDALFTRLKRGWSIENALMTPTQARRRAHPDVTRDPGAAWLRAVG